MPLDVSLESRVWSGRIFGLVIRAIRLQGEGKRGGMFTEILIVVLLILVNGLFSMAEMSVVSARKNRLMQKAVEGDAGAVRALELARSPTRFLSTIQIGITLIGLLTGAISGSTIAEQIGLELNKVYWLNPYGVEIGLVLVVVVITLITLLFGELVPKRLALNNPERVAISIAPLMQILTNISAPAVNLLSTMTELILRIFGVQQPSEVEVTEDDLKQLIGQGTESGAIEESEQNMVERIFRLSDRSVSALMTPRIDVLFLDIDETDEEIYQKIASNPYSRYPVMQDTPDNVIGFVHTRDLLLQRIEGAKFDVRNVLRKPLFIPESTPALDVLENFRETGAEMGLIFDEYGGVSGLISVNDMLVAIVGDVFTPQDEQEADAIRREDGSWLFDGMIRLDVLKDYLDIDELPDEAESNYETLSGLMMMQLGRIPDSGDYFEWRNLRFEVVDMDGRRVDKVLVASIPKE
jgi:putative hemolysin